jgi:Polysaccharide deacetylase
MGISDEHDVKSIFYVRAVALERNRKAARLIGEKGHDVVCHGYRWEDVTLLTREQEREHIRLAVKSIIETTGERPLGWYCRTTAPHGHVWWLPKCGWCFEFRVITYQRGDVRLDLGGDGAAIGHRRYDHKSRRCSPCGRYFTHQPA